MFMISHQRHLRISVWQGDVVLKDLNLKAEALNSLNLPVAVKAGLAGTITLRVVLQLAESGSFFVDLIKQSLNITHRKFNPMKDPCSVLWDVLKTMDLTRGKKDLQKALPSRLVLHLKTNKSTDTKEQVRIIKCNRGFRVLINQQIQKNNATEVLIRLLKFTLQTSIERAMITYGRNLSKELLKKATKPYSPVIDGTAIELIPKEGACNWCPK